MSLNLPDPDTSRLAGSPLELVVCQIRFENRLLGSDSATALAFHRSLGGSEGPYQNVEPVEGQALNVTVGPGVPPVTETKPLTGWRMTAEDGHWIVTLMPDHVALETTHYTTWDDDFEPRLAALIDSTAEHVRPTFEQRIGLRYIDRIKELQLGELSAWKPYIRNELLGPILHPEFGSAVRAAHQQLLIEVERGVACGLRHGPIADEERVDYVLDYDVYRQGGRPFDPDGIKAAARAFNRYALQLFHASVTSALLEQLRQP